MFCNLQVCNYQYVQLSRYYSIHLQVLLVFSSTHIQNQNNLLLRSHICHFKRKTLQLISEIRFGYFLDLKKYKTNSKLLIFPLRRPQRQKKASELDAEVAGAGAAVAGAGAAVAVGGATAAAVGPAPAAKKVEKPELSRREREEIEKARAKAHYQVISVII